MKDYYDVIVIGGGPAGSTAAKISALSGLNTLLVEKREKVGRPVRCGEAVPGKHLSPFLRIKPRWISSTVNGAILTGPEGGVLEQKAEQVGYVLNRERFDADLSEDAQNAGADCLLNTEAVGYDFYNDMISSVVMKDVENKTYEVKTKLVIGADGMSSSTGRWYGIDTNISKGDTHFCLQYNKINVSGVEDEYMYFFVDRDIMPGGYGWVFPKGDGRANVGISLNPGIIAIGKKKPVDYLRDFNHNYSFEMGPDNTDFVSGIVSALPGISEPVKGNLMLAGDAGRLAEPLSGAGIGNAIHSGFRAGKVASIFFENRCKTDILKKEYGDYLKSNLLKRMQIYYRVRKVFQKLSNVEISRVITLIKRNLNETKNNETIDFIPLLRDVFLNNTSLMPKLRYALY